MRPPTLLRGDLAVVRSRAGSAVVMMTDVRRRLVQGFLIDTCPEMATDMDIAIDPGEVTPYPLVVQFDLQGPFYRSQVAQVVGHVPVDRYPISLVPDSLQVAGITTHLEHMGVRCQRGLPLLGRGTGRWDWKVEQLEVLQSVSRPFWQAFEW